MSSSLTTRALVMPRGTKTRAVEAHLAGFDLEHHRYAANCLPSEPLAPDGPDRPQSIRLPKRSLDARGLRLGAAGLACRWYTAASFGKLPLLFHAGTCRRDHPLISILRQSW